MNRTPLRQRPIPTGYARRGLYVGNNGRIGMSAQNYKQQQKRHRKAIHDLMMLWR